MTRPATSLGAGPAPDMAREVFGDRLPTVAVYADLLAGDGIEHGLLGPRERDQIWDRHILNSAVLASYLPHGAAVLDVGSGAGLPGIPLAYARPDVHLTLVEPMTRRVRFLTTAAAALRPAPFAVRQARAEDLPAASADVVVTRAVAPLARLVPMTLRLLRPGGVLLALKGRRAAAERRELEVPPGATVELLTGPQPSGETTIVRVTRTGGGTA